MKQFSAMRLGLLLFAALLAGATALRAHESTLHRHIRAQLAAAAAAESVAASLAPRGSLTIDLHLTGAPASAPVPGLVPGLVRLTDVGSGRRINLPAHLHRQAGWYSLPAGTTVDVPAGELRIEACRGLDTKVATATVRVAANQKDARAVLSLRRFYDPAARGLVGANTHLHLRFGGAGGAQIRTRAQAEEHLATFARSDALDLVFVSHLVRVGEDHDYVTNEFTRDDFARLSGPGVLFVNGEEHRHEGGRLRARGGPGELRYGHVMFLDTPRLVQPVSYGAIFERGKPASDALPLRRGITEARAMGSTIIWCHGRQGLEGVPNWIAGLLDAQNIFDGGSEGSVERVFYQFLNAGLRIPFSTGTDWGAYDFSRVYVPLAGPATSEAWRAQLAQGRSYITNGPFLEFEAGGQNIGDTLALPSAQSVRVRARGIARDDFERLELIYNGAVVATAARRAEAGHFAAELDTSVDLREPGWLALRIPTDRVYSDRTAYEGAGANIFGKALFAHTSPIYVTLAGRAIAQPEAIAALIDDLRASIATIEARGAFADDAERERLLAIYRDAIRTLERKSPANR